MHTRMVLNIHACVTQDKPLGHPNCLKGKTFVITGTLDSLYRGEAEDYIKRHSGRVTGSVSGKTDFLLVGENSGNSKVNQACVSFWQSALSVVVFVYVCLSGCLSVCNNLCCVFISDSCLLLPSLVYSSSRHVHRLWPTRKPAAKLARVRTTERHMRTPWRLSLLFELNSKSRSIFVFLIDSLWYNKVQYDVPLLTAMMATDCDVNQCLPHCSCMSLPVSSIALLSAIRLAFDWINVVPTLTAFTDMQAADKGTQLVDEDGLFSLVAAAPEMAVAAAKPEVKAEGASALAAIPAGNFYAGKTSAASGAQAKKAALSASSMAASGVLFALDLLSIALVPL